MTEKKSTFTEHLIELRTCLIHSTLALLGATALCLYQSREIFRILQRPLLKVLPEGSGFIATNPIEALLTYLKVSLLAGVFIASPVILHQIWRFVAPALYRNEKKWASLFVVFATLFFVGGASFGYFVIFPLGFRFFVSALAGTGIQLLPQMKDYLGFISRMLLTFGLVFEMPIVLLLLARIGLVRHPMLSRARRYVVVLMFLAAGLLTPGPDILSQMLLALPLLVLYEISLLAVRIVGKS